MSRAVRPAASKALQKTAASGQALALFDDMIALLQQSLADLPQAAAGLPAEPLPSLLQQCEALAAKIPQGPPRLLVALEGRAEAEENWWSGHVAGAYVHAVTPLWGELSDEALRELLALLQRDVAAKGQELILLAGFGPLANRMAVLCDEVDLLICHPWQGYLNSAARARGESLESYCQAVLDLVQTHPAWRLKWPAPPTAGKAEAVSIALDRQGGSGPQPGWVLQDMVAPAGGAAYPALCASWGYAPDALPAAALMRQAEPMLPIRGGAQPVQPAQVSWALARLRKLQPDLRDDEIGGAVHQLDQVLPLTAPLDALDALIVGLPAREGALLLLLGATHFLRSGQSNSAMGLIADALDLGPPAGLRAYGASLYAEMNRIPLALEVLCADLLAPGVLEAARQGQLRALFADDAAAKAIQHGQGLLIAALEEEPPLPAAGGRRRLLVEIGTTRENVPGQGSTRQLAQLCQKHGLDFVTVDMDPANSRRAQRMFARMGLPFQAVTAKGEDYLAAHPGPIDYIFLDAYDFDHGQHSEIRQSRYETFLGDRISDAACHQMHLDCVIALERNLAQDGLICFDDTWLDEDGAWTAKGKTAMPYLLEAGFETVDIRNRAALLRRKA